jgi:basic amino acid/polyamine antiporter, APA family
MVGYPILPAIFVVVMLGIVLNTIWKTPFDSIWGLCIVALGLPAYVVWNKWGRR